MLMLIRLFGVLPLVQNGNAHGNQHVNINALMRVHVAMDHYGCVTDMVSWLTPTLLGALVLTWGVAEMNMRHALVSENVFSIVSSQAKCACSLQSFHVTM